MTYNVFSGTLNLTQSIKPRVDRVPESFFFQERTALQSVWLPEKYWAWANLGVFHNWGRIQSKGTCNGEVRVLQRGNEEESGEGRRGPLLLCGSLEHCFNFLCSLT